MNSGHQPPTAGARPLPVNAPEVVIAFARLTGKLNADDWSIRTLDATTVAPATTTSIHLYTDFQCTVLLYQRSSAGDIMLMQGSL